MSGVVYASSTDAHKRADGLSYLVSSIPFSDHEKGSC